MIDEDRIRELEGEIGAADLGLVIETFLEEASETIAGLGAGSSGEALGRAMHFLRSGALNMGLRGFASAAAAIERDADGDPVAAADTLRDILERTRSQLPAG